MNAKAMLIGAAVFSAVLMQAGRLMACATIAPEAMSKGTALVREGRSQEAIVELNKGLADGYNNRGEAYQIAGRWNEAMADFNKATELNPNDSRPYLGRAQYYINHAAYIEALEELNKSIAVRDQFSSWAIPSRAWLYNMKNDLNFALNDYNTLLQANPKDAVYLTQRGFIYYQMGNVDLALADFNAAIALNAQIPHAYLGRSVSYESKGDKLLAQENLAKVRQLNVRLADDFADAAQHAYKDGMAVKAREFWKYALLINPALKASYAALDKQLAP